MNTAQIISNHIANRKLNISVKNFISQVEATLKQKNAKIVRSGDVMFLFSVTEDAALIYIINGGSPLGYIKAVKQFVLMAKKFELRYIKMRVSDTVSAQKIANSAGLTNVKFDMFKEGTTDPYMMTAEI